MTWLAVMLLAAVVVLVARRWDRRTCTPSPEREVQAQLELYAIRRRLDVAWVRHHAGSDALRLRRELDAELAEEEA